MAAIRLGYASAALVAVVTLVGGLDALAIHPLVAVLIMVAGMAFGLYAAAGLCGTYLSGPGKGDR